VKWRAIFRIMLSSAIAVALTDRRAAIVAFAFRCSMAPAAKRPGACVAAMHCRNLACRESLTLAARGCRLALIVKPN
jgi:hypothetical protein